MSKIFNLNNKLVSVNHKITKEEFIKMNIPQKDFEAGVKAELIKQLAIHTMRSFPITVTQPTEEKPEFTWNSRGYILTERDMLNTIIEICDYDDVQREIIAKASKEELDKLK